MAQTPDPSQSTPSASSLPPEALSLAERLFDAARNGDSNLLNAALAHNPRVANLTNSKGDSLLMLASYHGHIDLTNLLLHTYQADPNVLNARSQSPLAGAAFKNEPEIIRLLLDAGADPDLGTPSAEECLAVFGLVEMYGKMFEEGRAARIHRNP
ncbi:MAG: hypothetical protein GOMPHAMPRED_008069 [Gomphillus americanus]|uniref:Ankyrin n=1 Tax=Gomphillus americanus TaxID=1940652 RepID=A0A8H3EYW2_9LECA|nr:MAG: hypothetical protein GOMPHAMPRED_008069 [Gomphillus americanus]